MDKIFQNTMQRIGGELFEAAPSLSKPCLLAVSGGVDSLCMANLFAVYFPGCFALAHCNFALRGKESDGDQALVESWAEEHGVPYYVKCFDTQSYARDKGLSIEMAARELRYGWFDELCREHGFSAVAVAHNANDNAETLMLNLLRGSGMSGIKGMAEVSELPVPGSQAKLIRPMLGATRNQIEGWMYARGFAHREDSTNAMSEYKRNRIRNEVFPVFESVNPSFVKTFNREMSYFSQAESIVNSWCGKQASKVVSETGDIVRISVKALLAVENWQYLLYYILERYGFNSATVASLTSLLETYGSATFSGKTFFAPDYRLVTSSDAMLVERLVKISPLKVELTENDAVVVLRSVGKYLFNGRSFSVRTEKWSMEKSPVMAKGIIAFDRAKLNFPIVCRRWEQGDWMRPYGMRGRKKLSDIFTDSHCSLIEKEAVTVIAPPYAADGDPHHVLAILGSRIDDSLKITPQTKEVIIIE